MSTGKEQKPFAINNCKTDVCKVKDVLFHLLYKMGFNVPCI